MRAELRPLLATALTAALASMIPSGDASAQGRLVGVVRNGGASVANAAVYLESLSPAGPVDPDSRKTIDQTHLSFVPRVLVVAPGTEVEFLNSDDVLHNVFGPGFTGVESFDLGTYPRGTVRRWPFRDEGLHVILCHIHPEMAAFIIVAPTRHKTLTTPDGGFALDGVEPGRYRLHVWHPRYWRNELVEEVTIRDGETRNMNITLTGDRAEEQR